MRGVGSTSSTPGGDTFKPFPASPPNLVTDWSSSRRIQTLSSKWKNQRAPTLRVDYKFCALQWFETSASYEERLQFQRTHERASPIKQSHADRPSASGPAAFFSRASSCDFGTQHSNDL